jgi:hypothetical protein
LGAKGVKKFTGLKDWEVSLWIENIRGKSVALLFFSGSKVDAAEIKNLELF